MQPESMTQEYTNTPIPPSLPTKSGLNWKRILLFLLVAVIAAALSGVAVWAYMNSKNESNTKELKAQITSKTEEITNLQSTSKPLDTNVAANTTTAQSSQQSESTGLYESLVNYCKTDNKSVGFATLSNGMTNGKNNQYFGSCSVAPAGALTGGYTLTALYANSAWTQLFAGQGTMGASADTCTKYHIPTQLGTC